MNRSSPLAGSVGEETAAVRVPSSSSDAEIERVAGPGPSRVRRGIRRWSELPAAAGGVLDVDAEAAGEVLGVEELVAAVTGAEGVVEGAGALRGGGGGDLLDRSG
jgi:hypothetical protein